MERSFEAVRWKQCATIYGWAGQPVPVSCDKRQPREAAACWPKSWPPLRHHRPGPEICPQTGACPIYLYWAGLASLDPPEPSTGAFGGAGVWADQSCRAEEAAFQTAVPGAGISETGVFWGHSEDVVASSEPGQELHQPVDTRLTATRRRHLESALINTAVAPLPAVSSSEGHGHHAADRSVSSNTSWKGSNAFMNKLAIVYWSGTGNTETMANCIADGARESGAEVAMLPLGSSLPPGFLNLVSRPSAARHMGRRAAEEDEVEPMFAGLRLSGRKEDRPVRLLRLGRPMDAGWCSLLRGGGRQPV